MKTQQKPIVEIRPAGDGYAATVELPGSTMRLSKTFSTEDEAIDYGNQLLAEFPTN